MPLILYGLTVTICVTAGLAQKIPKPHNGILKVPAVAPSHPIAPPSAIPQPTPPLPPAETMPPEPPFVKYDGEQLTITCDNSTLADILSAVQAQTGAEIDLPATASTQRIAARLGPGPARAVLATLLSWTDFDYAIQASDTDLEGIQSVLLTPRAKNKEAVANGAGTSSTTRPILEALHRAARPSATAAEALAPQPATSAEAAAEDQQVSPPDQQTASAQATPTDSQSTLAEQSPTQADLRPVPGTSESDPAQGAIRTSEQRIQDMQRMFQQRRQIQAQQVQTTAAPK